MSERTWYARVLTAPGTPGEWHNLGPEIDLALKAARSLCAALRPGEGKVFLYDAPPSESGYPASDYWAGWMRGLDGELIRIP